MTIRPVLPSERFALLSLLMQDPVPNLFLLSLLEQAGQPGEPSRGIFYGCWERAAAGRGDGELAGIAYLSPSGLVVPWCPWVEHSTALGRHLASLHHLHLLIGPRAASDALWEGYGQRGGVRARYEQRLYCCEQASPGPVPAGLRLAREADAPQVAHFASRMMLEDLGFDPAQLNPRSHASAILRRIREGRTWVVEQGGQLIFKIDLGCSTSEGAMLGGTYVVPRQRGRGIGQGAVRGVLRDLLLASPRVTLHLNEANAPAVRCYERAGFRRDAAFRLLLLERQQPGMS